MITWSSWMQRPFLIFPKKLFEVQIVEIVDDLNGDAVYLRGLECVLEIIPEV
jgi:hypothetical protein